MLYLVGLGLSDEMDITVKGLEIVKKAARVYLEAYTSGDSIEGDRRGWHNRSAAAYRQAFRSAGLTSVGMHCWVGAGLRSATAELERT